MPDSTVVNADEPDKDIAFVRERGQRRPATQEEIADGTELAVARKDVMVEEIS